jgi:hypothetical protein
MCNFEVEVIVQSDEIAQEVLWKLHDKYEKSKKKKFLAGWGVRLLTSSSGWLFNLALKFAVIFLNFEAFYGPLLFLSGSVAGT